MAFLGIGTKSTSGIVCDSSTVFINVSAKDKVIDLSDPMSSDFGHYLVYDFLERNHCRHHRHIDNSIELESHHAQAFLSFASKAQLELDNLTKRSYELDQAQSHEIEVHDREKFDEHLQAVTIHKSNIEQVDRYIDSLKVQLYQATGTSQGIDGVTKATVSVRPRQNDCFSPTIQTALKKTPNENWMSSTNGLTHLKLGNLKPQL
jgi:hypothetical protein